MWLFIGTTFYTSLLFKKAPGTISSFVVFGLFYFATDITLSYKLIILGLIGLAHFLCFPTFERVYKDEDPSLYTLDESFAIILLSIFVHPGKEWIIAFFVFRFFDILKPLGIKKFERLSIAPAVVRNVGDDIIAAIYTYIMILGYRYVS